MTGDSKKVNVTKIKINPRVPEYKPENGIIIITETEIVDRRWYICDDAVDIDAPHITITGQVEPTKGKKIDWLEVNKRNNK